MKAFGSGCVWWNSKGLVCIDPSWFKMAATLFDLEISIPTASIDIPSFVSIYGYPAFQSTHIFNRETGAMSQLAESSTKQWRLADTFVCGRGVPIGNFVRPYLHFKGKEQGRIDLTLTL